MYVAGADPYKEDQLGGLALTIDGLMERDRLVFSLARHAKIPVCVTLAGRLREKRGRHGDDSIQHREVST